MTHPMKPVLKTGKTVDPLLRVTTDFIPNYSAINLSNSTIAASDSVIFEGTKEVPQPQKNKDISDLVRLLAPLFHCP